MPLSRTLFSWCFPLRHVTMSSSSPTHSPGPPAATVDKPTPIDAPTIDVSVSDPVPARVPVYDPTPDIDDARIPRISLDPMLASPIADKAFGNTLATNFNIPDIPHTPILTNDTPVPNISFVDLLDADPRPTLVLSLAPPVPRAVYANPAFASTGFSYSQDALWADIESKTTPLPPVTHLGYSWTRSVLRCGQYAVVSANHTVSVPETMTPTAAVAAPEDIPLPTSPNAQRPARPLISMLMPPIPTTAGPTTPTIPTVAIDRVVPSLHPLQHTEPLTPPASAVFLAPSQDQTMKTDTPVAATTTHTLDATPDATPEETAATKSESFFPAENRSDARKDTQDTLNDTQNDAHAASSKYLDQFEAITDFMPVGMCVVDAAGNIVSANIAWHHILGCAWPPTEADTAPDGLVMTRAQFLSYVEDEDQELVQNFFANGTLVPTSTFGFRVKKYRLKGAKKAQSQSQNQNLEDSVSTNTSTTPTPLTPSRPSPVPHIQEASTPKKSASFPVAGSSSSAASQPCYNQIDVPRAPVRRDSLVLSSAASTPDEAARDSHVLATTHSEMDADGNLLRVLVCLRDITEHQHIAEAADRHARQANNLRRMAEFATVGMYDMDVDGRLRGANKVFYEMCGIQSDAVDTAEHLSQENMRPWIDCVVDEDQHMIETCFQRLFGGPHDASKDNRHVDHWTVVEAGANEYDVDNDETDDEDNKDGNDNDDDAATKIEAETDYQTAELRFKTPWTTDDGSGGRIVAPRWVEASFLPVRDADGKVQSITGCLTDISLRRWQLERERQVKEEAIESKRQQENFVDITSHEIRNPLTVIMHCGDAVLESLTRLREDVREDKQRAMLDDVIDSAEIIVSSALHQKAIVDDILTMSKLDSNLLAVTPVTVDPIEIVRSTLRMFEVQARQQHIQLRMTIDPSYYKELPVVLSPLPSIPAETAVAAVTAPFAPRTPFLVFDPSRVKQILINLLTNALKFTQSVSVREIITTVSVSRSRPTDAMCAVSFVPQPPDNKLAPAYGGPGGRGRGPGRGRGRSRGTGTNSTSNSPSPSSPSSTATTATAATARTTTTPLKGDSVFLIFEVRDTGEGLTKEGVDSLFQKFVQADSSTHVKHGGSGLGLFISKRLAEIQNGAIGVASERGVGSTFVFYIEAYIPPPSAVPEILSPGEAAKIALAAGLGNAAGGISFAPVAPAYPAAPVATVAEHTKEEGTAPLLTAINVASLPSPLAIAPTIMSPLFQQDGQQQAITPTMTNKDRSDSYSSRSAVMHAIPHSIATSYATPASVGSQTAPPTPTTTTDSPTILRPVSTFASAGQPPVSQQLSFPTSSTISQGELAAVSATPPEIHGVLLVEDNIVNQKVTRRYFEKLGFNVEVAANGVEAMESIRASDRCVPGSFPISVVLMDMEMPVQDGLTCTRHIRELEAMGAFAGGRMPVLMITGNARPEQIADARAAGCDDVVVKPFQMHLLFEHIKLVMHTLWANEIRALAAINRADVAEATEEVAEDAPKETVEAIEPTPTSVTAETESESPTNLSPVLEESKAETDIKVDEVNQTDKVALADISPQLDEGVVLHRQNSDQI
ncbi:histidine kinase m1nbp [Ophiostoma piceae UAMH 11346]|uniref:Histidine kinase m1nbp n=1 Tax=Ophiostoma piceae (strain UAMH 11346) TaxID=1262450 RepID=S3CTA3_OPHP1|nr:histidine kinase m1nbp [Ophiostoma piceae UAMH 11346]